MQNCLNKVIFKVTPIISAKSRFAILHQLDNNNALKMSQ